jgi:DNA-binding transcriptional ArsR family regulator
MPGQLSTGPVPVAPSGVRKLTRSRGDGVLSAPAPGSTPGLTFTLAETKVFWLDQLLQALTAPRRREILALVRRGERGAGEIHRALGDITFGAVSQHLGVLERAGLVTARREGRSRLYAARPGALVPLRRWLESMWDHALGSLKGLSEAEETARRAAPEPGKGATAHHAPRAGRRRRRPGR